MHQPITLQQLNTFKYLNNGDNNLVNNQMEKKGNVSDFECGLIVGARWANLSVLEPADLLGFMLARQRTVEKKTKN